MSAAEVVAWRAIGIGGAGDAGEGRAAETRHRVHVAVVAPDGRLVAHAGDPEIETPLRSTLKPIQAQALFLSGAFERFAVTSEELALACASHEGAPRHTAIVAAFLARIGLSERDLACGAHEPSDPEGLAALRGAAPSALHNNCSGKHAAMLAAALALGAPTKDYLRPTHPVQQLVRYAIDAVCGGAEVVRGLAVDGCSAPTPIVSVRALARMYAALAAPKSLGDRADDRLGTGLAAAYDAMTAHPELVGGRGVLDTVLMRSLSGIAAKRGADGGYAIALRGAREPLGVALKVESGAVEARAPAVLAVLEALGAMTPAARFALKELIRPARKNHRGLVVGSWEAAIDLQRSA